MKKKSKEKELDEDHAELDYEDSSVRELLTLMKDDSELIADLAYAAMVFENEELAEEVHKLESEMDKKMYQIRLKSMLGARTRKDAEQLSGLLQLASAAEQISDAAEDMVHLLDAEIDLKPLLPHLLKKADEKVFTLKIEEGSDLANRKIGDLHLESVTGVRVIAIRDDLKWIHGPTGETELEDDDLLIVRGQEEGYEKLWPVAHKEKNWEEVVG
ncbi:MAG: TrkA C-terminal domain-containing protein [Candidatus Thermoplasmatota archaeon]